MYCRKVGLLLEHWKQKLITDLPSMVVCVMPDITASRGSLRNEATIFWPTEKGFELTPLPMKIRGGSGGPLRAVTVIRAASDRPR